MGQAIFQLTTRTLLSQPGKKLLSGFSAKQSFSGSRSSATSAIASCGKFWVGPQHFLMEDLRLQPSTVSYYLEMRLTSMALCERQPHFLCDRQMNLWSLQASNLCGSMRPGSSRTGRGWASSQRKAKGCPNTHHRLERIYLFERNRLAHAGTCRCNSCHGPNVVSEDRKAWLF